MLPFRSFYLYRLFCVAILWSKWVFFLSQKLCLQLYDRTSRYQCDHVNSSIWWISAASRKHTSISRLSARRMPVYWPKMYLASSDIWGYCARTNVWLTVDVLTPFTIASTRFHISRAVFCFSVHLNLRLILMRDNKDTIHTYVIRINRNKHSVGRSAGTQYTIARMLRMSLPLIRKAERPTDCHVCTFAPTHKLFKMFFFLGNICINIENVRQISKMPSTKKWRSLFLLFFFFFQTTKHSKTHIIFHNLIINWQRAFREFDLFHQANDTAPIHREKRWVPEVALKHSIHFYRTAARIGIHVRMHVDVKIRNACVWFGAEWVIYACWTSFHLSVYWRINFRLLSSSIYLHNVICLCWIESAILAALNVQTNNDSCIQQ